MIKLKELRTKQTFQKLIIKKNYTTRWCHWAWFYTK